MRFSALVLLAAVAAMPAAAQTPPASSPPAGAPPGAAAAAPPPGAISREDYIKRAADRAAARFDRIDANHTGYLTREQIRAYYLAHRRVHHAPPPATAPAPAEAPKPQ
jgi:hypothetical protein